jgi:prepilin-type N-terminal cleavage/methylation domain-containing protein
MKKGFTLIELLIVIGILAILATAVVLVLNPAQILAQARDAQRISDLSSVKSAIALYLATVTSTPSMTAGPRSTAFTSCHFGTCTLPAATDLTKVDGNGWVGVNLTLTSGGSSLGALPIDPLNNSTSSQYSFKANTTALTFELDGVLESQKYAPLMANDGGTNSAFYEIGTSLSL